MKIPSKATYFWWWRSARIWKFSVVNPAISGCRPTASLMRKVSRCASTEASWKYGREAWDRVPNSGRTKKFTVKKNIRNLHRTILWWGNKCYKPTISIYIYAYIYIYGRLTSIEIIISKSHHKINGFPKGRWVLRFNISCKKPHCFQKKKNIHPKTSLWMQPYQW